MPRHRSESTEYRGSPSSTSGSPASHRTPRAPREAALRGAAAAAERSAQFAEDDDSVFDWEAQSDVDTLTADMHRASLSPRG